jgi:pyridoxal phosphate enzyme (YggS family)
MPSSKSEPDPSARLRDVLARIAAAAVASGRRPDAVTLVAVCKQQPWSNIVPILAAGQRSFGENRVQEAAARWRDRREQVSLRLIGPLQTNKAREAVDLFDVIETLDRPKLARALAEAFSRSGRSAALYVQVNTGEEPQKAGVSPPQADAFIAACRGEFGLTIEGLMCVPPQHDEPALHFALLAKIAARNGLDRLSMGMSADFETAIRFGATSVRVGSALFGARSTTAAPI